MQPYKKEIRNSICVLMTKELENDSWSEATNDALGRVNQSSGIKIISRSVSLFLHSVNYNAVNKHSNGRECHFFLNEIIRRGAALSVHSANFKKHRGKRDLIVD